MNSIASKRQKCCTHKNAFKIKLKILRQPKFFGSQPSALPTEALVNFYLSTTFGLSLMISSVAPTGWLTFYAYLITKIGNRNLKNPLRIPLKLHLLNISLIKQLSSTIRLSAVCCSLGHMVVNTIRLTASQFSKIYRPILSLF